MGGRATQRITMSKQDLESALETEESININMAVGVGAETKSPGFGMSVQADVSAERSTFDAQTARNAMSRLETQVRTNIVGGTPALGSMQVDALDMEHMELWAGSVATDPAPISYSLSLLSDAITPYAFPELDAERLGRMRHSVETALVRLCGPACMTDAAPTRKAFDVALPFGCSTLPEVDAPELEIGSCPAPSLSVLAPAPSCDDGTMSAVWMPAVDAASATLRRTRALVFKGRTTSGRSVARVFPIGGTQVNGNQFHLSGGNENGRYCGGAVSIGGGTTSRIVPKPGLPNPTADGEGEVAMVLWKTWSNCGTGVTDAYRQWGQSPALPFGTVLDMVAYVPHDALQLNPGEDMVSSSVGIQDVVVTEIGPQVVAVVRAWKVDANGDPDVTGTPFLQVTQLPKGVLTRDAGFVFVAGIRNNGRYCARASLGTSLDIHPRFGAAESATDVIVWDGAAHSYCAEGIRTLSAGDPKLASVHAHVDTAAHPPLDVNAGRVTFVEVQRNLTNGELPGGLVAVVVAHTATTLIHKAFALPAWYVNGHVSVTGEPIAGGTDQGKACNINAAAGSWHSFTITADRHLFVVAGYWMCQCHWKTPGVSDDSGCTPTKYYNDHNDRILAHVTLEDLGLGSVDKLVKVEVAVMRVDNYNATRQPAAFAPASTESTNAPSHVRWQCESTPLRFGDRVRVATAFGRQLVLPRGSVKLSAGGFTSLIPQCPAGGEMRVHKPATSTEASLKSPVWFSGHSSALRLRSAPVEAAKVVTVTVTLGNLTTVSFKRLLPADAGAPPLWVSGQQAENHYNLVNNPDGRFTTSVEFGQSTTAVSLNRFIDLFVFSREESGKAGFRKVGDAIGPNGEAPVRGWITMDTQAMLIQVNMSSLGLDYTGDAAREVESVKVSYAEVTTPVAQASCEGHEWNRCGGVGGNIEPTALPAAAFGSVVVAWECTGATEHPPFQLVSPRPSRNMRREPVRFGDLVLLGADGCGLATLPTDAGGLWKPIQCVSPLSSATRLRIEGGTPGGVVSNMADVTFTVLDTNSNEHRDMLQDVTDTQLLSRLAGGCVTNDMVYEDLPLAAQIAEQAYPTMVTSPTRLPQWLAACDVDSRWTLHRVKQDTQDVKDGSLVTFAVSLQQDTPAQRGDKVAVWVDVVFSEPVLNPAAPNSRLRTAPSPLGVMPALVCNDFKLFLGTADDDDGCATVHDEVTATELWFRPGGRAPDAYALEGYFTEDQISNASCVGVRVAPATVGQNSAALESSVKAVPFTPPTQASFVCRSVTSIALPVGVFDPAVRSLASTAYGYLECNITFAAPVVSAGFTRAAPDDLSVHTTCTSPQLPLSRVATSTHPVHVESAAGGGGGGITGWGGNTTGVTRLTAWMDIEALLPAECARLIVPGDPLGPLVNLEVKLAGTPGRLVQVSQPHYAVPETPFTGSFDLSVPF